MWGQLADVFGMYFDDTGNLELGNRLGAILELFVLPLAQGSSLGS